MKEYWNRPSTTPRPLCQRVKPPCPPRGFQRQALALSLLMALLAPARVASGLEIPETNTAEGLIENDETIPVVLTPTRLKQPRTDVPAAVTVITGEQLQRYGVRHLHEVFRLVPGMTVGVTSYNTPVLSYHGTNASEQRRLQVLIDGRSQYAPNLATVDWYNLPVPLEEIERIEVTRGPNAAAYGANSFLGIINIITRHPFDTPGNTLSWIKGNEGYQRYYARHGGSNDQGSWRLSVHGVEDQGFEIDSNDQPLRDGVDLNGFNLSLATASHARDQLQFQAGLKNGTHEFGPRFSGGALTNPDRSDRDRFASLRWIREVNEGHSFHVQVYGQDRARTQRWINSAPQLFFSPRLDALSQSNSRLANQITGRLLGPDAEQSLLDLGLILLTDPTRLGTVEDSQLALQILLQDLPSGSGANCNDDGWTCGQINADIREKRWDIEFQDTLTFSDSLRMVSGLSYREDRYVSETYFGGQGENRLGRAFMNAEIRPAERFLFNIGGMLELDEANGDYLSPRAALNIRLDEHQALRFVISHAIRTPDTYEESVRWSYTARELDPPLDDGRTEARTFLTLSPGGLDNEKIISREIGYYVNRPDYGLEADIKVFRDNLWDLISAPLQYFYFQPENNLALTQTGAELDMAMSLGDRDRVRLTYAYLDQDAKYTGSEADLNAAIGFNVFRLYEIESRLNAEHSGSAAWEHEFSQALQTALVYYQAEELNGFDYQRGDLVIHVQQPFGQHQRVRLMLKMEYLFTDEPLLFKDYRMADRQQYFAGLTLDF